MIRSTIRSFFVAFAVATSGFVACGPSLSNVHCHNGGECRQIDERYSYCLESRCVECVSSSSCKRGQRCVNGSCEFESQ